MAHRNLDIASDALEFQGGLLVRMETKRKNITELKSALRMVLIRLLFHAVSCHVKIVLQNVKNLISGSENCVNFLNW